MPRRRHTGPPMTDGLHPLRTHRRRRVAPPERAQGALALPAKRPTSEMIAEDLTVPERLMLFCVACATDWTKAGLTHTVARELLIRGLIDRKTAGSFSLTDQGRAVLEALMMRAATRG